MNFNEKYSAGWDVGGAHLKVVVVDSNSVVCSVKQLPCPLWKGIHELSFAVEHLMATELPENVMHSITMTGELADIFQSRREGVNEIARLMADKLGCNVRFYAGKHGFLDLAQVDEHYQSIASANWHASASLVATQVKAGVFIDVGSTTTDLIPFNNGLVLNKGFIDAERMRNDELVYTGVIRTPLMALTQKVAFKDHEYHVAAEYFATMADVYRITGDLTDAEDMASTADGADKSLEASMRRIARMIGHDYEEFSDNDWLELAQSFKAAQMQRLEAVIQKQLDEFFPMSRISLVTAGAGRFLTGALAERLGQDQLQVEHLIDAQSPELRQWAGVCYPAYAMAVLPLEIGI
jgi:probable H4MPT-linked C1 transfer pathway protein